MVLELNLWLVKENVSCVLDRTVDVRLEKRIIFILKRSEHANILLFVCHDNVIAFFHGLELNISGDIVSRL